MGADTFHFQTLTPTNQTTRSHIPVRVKGWICTNVKQVQSPSHAHTYNSYTPQSTLPHPHNTAINILLNSEITCCWRNMTDVVENMTPSGEHAQSFTSKQTHKYLQTSWHSTEHSNASSISPPQDTNTDTVTPSYQKAGCTRSFNILKHILTHSMVQSPS